MIFWKTLNYDETSLFIYLDSVYGAYYLVKDAGQWSVPVPIATPFDDGNGLDITGLEIDVFLTNQNRIAFLWVDEQGQLNMAETWIRYLEFDYQWEMSFIGDNVLVLKPCMMSKLGVSRSYIFMKTFRIITSFYLLTGIQIA